MPNSRDLNPSIYEPDATLNTPEPDESAEPDESELAEQLRQMTNQALESVLEDAGHPKTGNKDELVERILADKDLTASLFSD